MLLSVSPLLTVYVRGVGEGGTVAVGGGSALATRAMVSKVGVGAGADDLGPRPQMASTISTVIAETAAFRSK
jgi:hypothetical protein